MIDIAESWALAFSPPDRRPIDEWASAKVELPPVLTKSGRFDVSGSRHFIAPLRALGHDKVRAVRILKPVRGGGTLLADLFIPYAIAVHRASVLFIMEDAAIADLHAERRTMPMLKSVPEIAAMLSANPHKTRKSNILFITGLPFSMQGPALGGLQAQGYQVVVIDEAWMLAPGVIGEARARLGDFEKTESSKLLEISQGGKEDSDWAREYAEGVEFIWRPRCVNPSCGERMPLEWTIRKSDNSIAGLVFDSIKNQDGSYNKAACAETARYACPHCGHEHPNSARTRSLWNESGEFVHVKTGEVFDPANPPTECSFRWHSLIDFPWGQLVKMWLAAQDAKRIGDFGPLVQFFQKRCALMRSEKSVHEASVPFARFKDAEPVRAEEGVGIPAMTVDLQREGLRWVEVRVWYASGMSRRLWFGNLYAEADIDAKRIEYGVAADCVIIDQGHDSKGTHGIYATCIRYGYICAKGVGGVEGFWHREENKSGPSSRVFMPWAPLTWGDPGIPMNIEGRTRAPLYRFASDVMSDRIEGLINAGLWQEPDGDTGSETETAYNLQMTAEIKTVEKDSKGRRRRVWKQIREDNHAWDLAKMQVLFAMHAGLLPAGEDDSANNNDETKDDNNGT